MAAPLVLYGNTPITSPYVLSVFVALEEKGLTYELKLLALAAGEQFEPEFVQRSLTNRVPTLRHGDFWLSESSAITEYLEDRFPPPKHTRLYPNDAQERARVRMVQGLMRSDFMPVREERSTDTVFQGAKVEPLSAAAQASATRLLRIASGLVGTRSSIANEFSIADADLAMMLQRLVANGDPVPAPLVSYANAIWQRPSIQKWLKLVKSRA